MGGDKPNMTELGEVVDDTGNVLKVSFPTFEVDISPSFPNAKLNTTKHVKHSWTHVKTGGQYILHAIAIDQDTEIPIAKAVYSPVGSVGVHVRKWEDFTEKFVFNKV